MQNSFKVAKWEVKKNLKNKSFIISLFLTPLIFLAFAIIPSLLSDSGEDEAIKVFIKDELNVYDSLETIVNESEQIDWKLEETTLSTEDIKKEVEQEENSAYILLTETVIDNGSVDVYLHEDVESSFMNEVHILEGILHELQIANLDLTDEQLNVISRGIAFDFHQEDTTGEENNEEKSSAGPFPEDSDKFLQRLIPGIFSGIILFSIVISGMMIFQSASQEKKDKIAEIILSSVTPSELMQGKIIGYFALGIIQVIVWLGLASPVVLWKVDMPIFKYLFVPELAVFLTIAILGYLIFASLFVGLGATIEDVSTSGNFQGLVFMLPFIPFMLLGPVITDPNGIVAKVGSFIPLTSPGILLFRLTMIEEWPKLEIALCIVILLVSVWLLMKLAGKVFQTGILLYGKNATPREIWRWLWM